MGLFFLYLPTRGRHASERQTTDLLQLMPHTHTHTHTQTHTQD